MALTLRLLGGLSTEQVARSFLVTEATMARRLASPDPYHAAGVR